MDIRQAITQDTAVLTLSGRLDTNTSPELERVIADLFQKGVKRMEMDIQELGYISSAGLRVLLSTHKKCTQTGGHLTILNAGEMAVELFEMTGFSSVLDLQQRQTC